MGNFLARTVAQIESDLDDVRATIGRVLTNQRNGTGNIQVGLAQLDMLQDLKKKLVAELARAEKAASGGACGITFTTGSLQR